MVTNLKNLKAANKEDVRIFTDDYGRTWTITNIEKEFWAWAFKLGKMAERLADAEDDETCEGTVELIKCDNAEEVQYVSNCN